MSTSTEENGAPPAANEKKPVGGQALVALLCALAIVSVLLFGAVDSGTLLIVAIFSVAIVAYWTWTSWRARVFVLNTDMLQIPLLGLGLIGLIQLLPVRTLNIPAGLLSDPSSTLSLDPYATRFFLMRLFFYIVFFAAAFTFVNTLSKVRTVVVVLIAFGALLAFYSILQRVEAPTAIYGLREPAQAIPFGTYVNGHHFAALMEMTLGVTLGLLFAGGLPRNRWPFLIAAGSVMAIAIVLTGSRGGMTGFVGLLALIVGAGIFTDKEKSGTSRRLAYVAGGSAFFVLTIGLTLFSGGADRLLRSAGIDPGAGDFTSGRLQFWQTGLKIIFAHPIIGAGLDAFGAAYSYYDTSNGALRVERAHNDYLQILADAGILGGICVAVFIFLLFRKSLSIIRDTHHDLRRGAALGALAGCFGILIHSFFDFPLRTPANGFVFLLLVVVAAASVVEPTARHRRGRRIRSEEDQLISGQ
jgi:O-antigen ligase